MFLVTSESDPEDLPNLLFLQCPHSEEEDSVPTIYGFGDEFHDLRVQTH